MLLLFADEYRCLLLYSRQDAYLGDPVPFNQAAWDETLQYWQDDTINVTTAAVAHAARIRTSIATNPDFGLSSTAQGFLSGESIAFILVFGNVDTGVVDAQSVKYWFGEYWLLPRSRHNPRALIFSLSYLDRIPLFYPFFVLPMEA